MRSTASSRGASTSTHSSRNLRKHSCWSQTCRPSQNEQLGSRDDNLHKIGSASLSLSTGAGETMDEAEESVSPRMLGPLPFVLLLLRVPLLVSLVLFAVLADIAIPGSMREALRY